MVVDSSLNQIHDSSPYRSPTSYNHYILTRERCYDNIENVFQVTGHGVVQLESFEREYAVVVVVIFGLNGSGRGRGRRSVGSRRGGHRNDDDDRRYKEPLQWRQFHFVTLNDNIIIILNTRPQYCSLSQTYTILLLLNVIVSDNIILIRTNRLL